jgi:hypothetical protein
MLSGGARRRSNRRSQRPANPRRSLSDISNKPFEIVQLIAAMKEAHIPREPAAYRQAKRREALMEKRQTRSRVALLTSFAVGLLLAYPAAATSVRARYTVFYLGLPVGDLETVKTFGVSTYQSSVDARVSGLATIVSNFKMNMKSNGIIRKDVVQPNNFAAEETGSGETQSMRMTLVGGSVKSAEIVPPVRDLDQRVPLLDEHRRNIVDPASSLIMTVPSGQDPLGPSACNRTFRMFDGFSRSDIALEFVKTDDVSTRSRSARCAIFQSPAINRRLP